MTPVPPLPTTNVPASVTAPEVAVLGVKPVVPALNVDTAVPPVDSVDQPDPMYASSAVTSALYRNAPFAKPVTGLFAVVPDGTSIAPVPPIVNNVVLSGVIVSVE